MSEEPSPPKGDSWDRILRPEISERRSEKPSPQKSGNIPMGIVGLVLAIFFCIQIAVFPVQLGSVLIGGALGLTGLALSIVGIAKDSGRGAGVCGILAFLLGCVITFTTVLDLIAQLRGQGE